MRIFFFIFISIISIKNKIEKYNYNVHEELVIEIKRKWRVTELIKNLNIVAIGKWYLSRYDPPLAYNNGNDTIMCDACNGENKKEQERTCQAHREDSLFQPVDLRAGPLGAWWIATLSITIAMLPTCLLSYWISVRDSIERSILDQFHRFRPIIPLFFFLSLPLPSLSFSSAHRYFLTRGAYLRDDRNLSSYHLSRGGTIF